MATSVQKLVGESIAIVTYTAPFDIAKDLLAAGQQLTEISQKVTGTLHIVIDISRLDLSFDEIMQGMGESSGDRLKEVNNGDVTLTFIGSPHMLQTVSESYPQQVDIYPTLDKALGAIRS